MKATKHISFFYNENRIKYLNKIIKETNNYPFYTDIFIHTNLTNDNTSKFKDLLTDFNNVKVHIIYHDLTSMDPFKLTWLCRDLLKKQKDLYDIFIYIEDDILVPKKAIKYWLYRNEYLVSKGYNLGFFRIETNFTDNKEYVLDLYNGKKLTKYIYLDNIKYYINDVNTYCAFWIYNKQEFNKFVNSPFYDVNYHTNAYETRESSAIGLHGVNCNFYKHTVIPVKNNKLHIGSKIYHLDNKYTNLNTKKKIFGTLPWNYVIS